MRGSLAGGPGGRRRCSSSFHPPTANCRARQLLQPPTAADPDGSYALAPAASAASAFEMPFSAAAVSWRVSATSRIALGATCAHRVFRVLCVVRVLGVAGRPPPSACLARLRDVAHCLGGHL